MNTNNTKNTKRYASNKFFIFLALTISILSIQFVSCKFDYKPSEDWTLMFYFAGDQNFIESCLLENVWQIKTGYSGGCNAIVFFDGNKNPESSYNQFSKPYSVLYERAFGEFFTGSRIYRIEENETVRIYGDENFYELATSDTTNLNAADPHILESFIKFSQKNYPAKHFALFIGAHGSGCDNNDDPFSTNYLASIKAIDDNEIEDNAIEDNIEILRAAITDFYQDTKDGKESQKLIMTPNEFAQISIDKKIELVAFDVCFMSSFEFLYELQKSDVFGARYYVACPSEEGIYGWYYKDILRYMNSDYHQQVDAATFAQFIVNAYYNYTIGDTSNTRWDGKQESYIDWQSITLIDASKLEQLKIAIDDFAISLYRDKDDFKNFHSTIWKPYTQNVKTAPEYSLYYFNPTKNISSADDYSSLYPFFDIYDLAQVAHEAYINSKINFANGIEIDNAAIKLMQAADDAVISSFANKADFPRSIKNTTGISIFFPKDEATVNKQIYDQLLSSKYSGKNPITDTTYSIVENWCGLLKKIEN